MKKKKIIIIIIVALIFILMLVPIPNRLKDGGTVEYNAILYQYTKIHRLSEKSSTGFENGWELKILGYHIGGKVDTYVTAEHKISIRSNDKIIEASTGSFCYKNGACIDKIDFQDFDYDIVNTYYGNKLYIDNLDGHIKSVELFNYSTREFTDIKPEYTNEYIVTPSVSGPYIFVISAVYENKSINYYFLANISKTSGEEINVKLDIKDGTLTDKGLTMVISNKSNKNISYGNPFMIEKYENGYYKTLKPINEMAFTLPAYGLNKNDSVELNIDWARGYGKLKGKYRIVKSFHYNENDKSIDFVKYLEFEI